MRRPRQCSILAEGAPRPASFGPTPLTTGHGAAVIHRAPFTSTHPIANPNGPSPIWRALRAFFQVDGYAGYRKLADRGDVRLAFCWSHVRRGFYELAVSGQAPIASEALERIAGFYAVENDARGRSPEERRTVRSLKSRPLVAALEPWLRKTRSDQPEKQACHGHPLRPVALGRPDALHR